MLNLLAERVAVRLRNSVAITTTILSIVGCIARSPGLVVERAVETLRNTILRENVCVEEAASLKATIGVGVSAVVPGLDCASRSAGRGIVALALAEGEELVAHVGVITLRIKGRVDGSTELLRPGETAAWWGRGVLVVAIGASDDDLEAVTPLSAISSLSL